MVHGAVFRPPPDPDSDEFIHHLWQPRCRSFRRRPVALRPRLSTGLPLCSGFDYATKTFGGTTTLVAFWDVDPGRGMRKPKSVSELLAEGKATLERLKSGAEAANRTLVALQRVLPADVAGHVFGAVLDGDGVLTVVADSGTYATRLRYLLPDVLPGLGETLGAGAITGTRVRVRPRGKDLR
jgi:hypothetical protein